MNHLTNLLMILFHGIHVIECQCLPLQPRREYNVSGSPDQEDPWIKGFTIFDYDIAVHVDTDDNEVSHRLQSSPGDPQMLDPSGQAVWPGRQIPFQLHPCEHLLFLLLVTHLLITLSQ